MNPHDTAFHRLAESFGMSDLAFGLSICALALGVIVGIGVGVVRVSAGVPPSEGERP